ncbi:MAG: cobalamin-binding protein [Bryobacteraceae bacterium]|nr:cobalamin-binding protein [Bryobacteraceae bacterium]
MPRIVSLIASATEILHALDLGSHQVGRSHECDFPESIRSLPVCTEPRFAVEGSSQEIDQRVRQSLATASSVYRVFDEILASLQPTHILTQTQCEVCAVSLKDVERAMSESFPTRPAVVALEPNSLADIRADIQRVADACGVAERGVALNASIERRMAAIAGRTKAAGRRPRVACIEWHEPLMAAGNWVPELVEMLGAINLFGSAGKHSPWMSWSDLAAADPDVILSMPCGFDLAKTASEMYWLEQNPAWNRLRAVREGEVYIADGNQYLNRPGPRVVESLRILGEILFPGTMPARCERIAWRRWTPERRPGA